jgi:hypothetical protein
LFDFRLFLPELDEEVFLFLGTQKPNVSNSDNIHPVTKTVPDYYLAKVGTDSAGRRVEDDSHGISQSVGPSLQYHVIVSPPGCLNNEVLLIQNCISSDTWLRDAIVAPNALLCHGPIGLLTGPCTSYETT